MQSILDQISSWLDKGRKIALATVIKTWGSSPRPAGALMAVTDRSEVCGSVSGGCVEGAVIDAALAVLKGGKPTRLHFGVANEEAWEVGLSCGGEIDVFVREFTRAHLDCWQRARARGERFCIALAVEVGGFETEDEWCIFPDGEVLPGPTPAEPPRWLKEAAAAAAADGGTGLIRMDAEEIQEAFLQVVDLPRRLILVGGVHIAIPLASLAETLGFEVIVVDPRRLFGTSERFPAVKLLLQEWPQEAFKKLALDASTAVVMLTHDPKIDDPAIRVALGSPSFYIGALGSVKTHQKRLDRLTAQGLAPADLKRIHAPVGLDLGGSSPEEIALAVLAEIIQVWHQER